MVLSLLSRSLALTLGLVLLLATPAFAQRGFTTAERDEMRRGYGASRDAHLALEQIAIAAGQKTAANESALSTVWSGLRQGIRDTGRGNFLWLGINPEDEDTLPCVAPFPVAGCHTSNREATARPTWLTDAWTLHDNAIFYFGETITAIDTASAVASQSAAYYAALTAARAKLVTAKAFLQAIDRTKTYAQMRNLPYCPDWQSVFRQGGTQTGSCNVFGPHGHWPNATASIAFGYRQLLEAVETLRLVFTANDGAETALSTTPNPAFENILTSYAKLAENIMIVQFNLAMVPVTATQCAWTPFQLVSRTVRRLLKIGAVSTENGESYMGNPTLWVMRGSLASNLNLFIADLTTRPQTHALLDTILNGTLRPWRDTEGGFWFGFEIPSDLYNVIVGQPAPRGVPSGTTVVTVPWQIRKNNDVRVYVRTSGAASEHAPLVEGVGAGKYQISNITSSGFTITLGTAPADEKHIIVERIARTRLEAHRRNPYPANDPDFGSLPTCSVLP